MAGAECSGDASTGQGVAGPLIRRRQEGTGAAQPGCRGWCLAGSSVTSTRTCQCRASCEGCGRESHREDAPCPCAMAAQREVRTACEDHVRCGTEESAPRRSRGRGAWGGEQSPQKQVPLNQRPLGLSSHPVPPPGDGREQRRGCWSRWEGTVVPGGGGSRGERVPGAPGCGGDRPAEEKIRGLVNETMS